MDKVILSLVVGLVFCAGSASAKSKTESVKNAESKMMDACKKEYPDAVKGKMFKAVADWVETEERGANAVEFKKSQCYNLHEDWEKVAGHNEEGEEHK
jgi:hypothetical protein